VSNRDAVTVAPRAAPRSSQLCIKIQIDNPYVTLHARHGEMRWVSAPNSWDDVEDPVVVAVLGSWRWRRRRRRRRPSPTLASTRRPAQK
jgi:hypothetical protein